MSTLLQIHSAYKSYGPRHLFSDAGFAINMGEHVGVIGPNGAGKTTLFKILAGQDEFDSGNIIKSRELRIGYLEQESDWNVDSTGEELLADSMKPIWELKKLGKGLGLTEDFFARPLSSLSGGYRMRFKLLWLLGQEPNLMMLDEPTNFLDLESLLVLENFLRDFKGAFLLISHDREFLKRTTDHTLEVEDGKMAKFPGDIEDYFEYKRQLHETLLARASNLQEKREKMEDFVERFRAKATKAKQAQSRLKQLEKLEEIEIKPMRAKARMQLPEPQSTGKETLALDKAYLGYQTNGEKKEILHDLNFRLQRGHHVGVVGINGAGKSTLLKTLAGRLPLLKGSLEIGYNVRVGYFAQHVYEELDINDSILESLQEVADKNATKTEILGIAGSFLFTGDDVHKKIKVLSGGEKSRVALCRLLLQKFPVLLLDEPTNHLDFDTVESMTEALKKFSGTLIVVSHDRHFIRQVSSKILEIRDGRAEYYPGTYDDYLWSLEKGAWSYKDESSSPVKESVVAKIESPKSMDKNLRKQREADLRKFKKQYEQLENAVKKNQEELASTNQKLIECKSSEAPALVKILGELSEKIERDENLMLELLEKIEALES
jgi:ATP-binding cassette subfamily F protein 3